MNPRTGLVVPNRAQFCNAWEQSSELEMRAALVERMHPDTTALATPLASDMTQEVAAGPQGGRAARVLPQSDRFQHPPAVQRFAESFGFVLFLIFVLVSGVILLTRENAVANTAVRIK